MGAVGILGREPEVEPMLGARGALDRDVEPEAAKPRRSDQHEIRGRAVPRLSEVEKTLLHEVAAGQPGEIHDPILQGGDPFAR